LIFSHSPQAAVALEGSAAAPLEFSPPAKIELAQEGTDTARVGKLVIRNATPNERTVKISVPAKIIAPAEITILPGAEKDVPLRTEDNFLGDVEGPVVAESEGFRQELDLHAFALQPRVEGKLG